jgi:hypothetical protein
MAAQNMSRRSAHRQPAPRCTKQAPAVWHDSNPRRAPPNGDPAVALIARVSPPDLSHEVWGRGFCPNPLRDWVGPYNRAGNHWHHDDWLPVEITGVMGSPEWGGMGASVHARGGMDGCLVQGWVVRLAVVGLAVDEGPGTPAGKHDETPLAGGAACQVVVGESRLTRRSAGERPDAAPRGSTREGAQLAPAAAATLPVATLAGPPTAGRRVADSERELEAVHAGSVSPPAARQAHARRLGLPVLPVRSAFGVPGGRGDGAGGAPSPSRRCRPGCHDATGNLGQA